MSRETTLILVGILTVVVPYTGFPSAWRTLFLVLCGITVAGIGFFMRAQTLSKPQHKTEHHPFQENITI